MTWDGWRGLDFYHSLLLSMGKGHYSVSFWHSFAVSAFSQESSIGRCRLVTILSFTRLYLIVYLGSYFGFFGLAFSFLTKRFNLTEVFLMAPFLWVSLEFIRSNMGFMAHPWPLLGHSQVPYPQVIQIASFSGAYGVSFLIVIINSAVAGLVLPYFTEQVLLFGSRLKPVLSVGHPPWWAQQPFF